MAIQHTSREFPMQTSIGESVVFFLLSNITVEAVDI